MTNQSQELIALLKRLESQGVRQGARNPEPPEPANANAGDRPRAERPRPLDQLFPNATAFGSDISGRAWRLRTTVDCSGRLSRQGYACPAAAFGGPPAPRMLAELTGDPAWAELDPARILYLDTETTGLATGAGTYVFLVGLGRFEGDAFIVEQFFMEDYDAEPALIDALEEALAGAGALVTYNGRGFDVPFLESRWRLQRRRPRFPVPHLDLLHYARRLWRGRLADCCLGTVEREILGVRRLSDVPGMLIPSIYFDYVRGRRAERIVPVFDHHAQDVFSLGALAALLSFALTRPDDPRFAHAIDQWGLSRVFEARGNSEAALACMERAVLEARDEAFGFRLSMRLARAYRRAGRAADAVAIWESRAAQARADRLDPLIELAKHAEHALRDPAAARAFCERALGVLDMHRELAWHAPTLAAADPERLAQARAALEHRMARLTRRGNASRKSATDVVTESAL